MANLYHKFFYFKSKEPKDRLKIFSITTFDNLKGKIFVEAFSERDVLYAITGIAPGNYKVEFEWGAEAGGKDVRDYKCTVFKNPLGEIKDGKINYVVEQELGVELVGDTKIKIAIDDDEEPWQDLTEKVITDAKEIEKQIDNEVKEDFLDN